MRARAPQCLARARGYIRSRSEENEPVLLHAQPSPLNHPSSAPLLLHLPDDILLLLLRYLPLQDLIRTEQVCSRLREVVISYSTYKARLDAICRSKRINNYMALSERAREDRSVAEVSAYYKVRLYQYTHKWRLRLGDQQDEYIRTYKVGRRKAELDRYVEKTVRRFSLSLNLIGV